MDVASGQGGWWVGEAGERSMVDGSSLDGGSLTHHRNVWRVGEVALLHIGKLLFEQLFMPMNLQVLVWRPWVRVRLILTNLVVQRAYSSVGGR